MSVDEYDGAAFKHVRESIDSRVIVAVILICAARDFSERGNKRGHILPAVACVAVVGRQNRDIFSRGAAQTDRRILLSRHSVLDMLLRFIVYSGRFV